MNGLGKRNSFVGGVTGRWRCPGGDSTTRAISAFMSNLLVSPSQNSSTYSTIFEVGIKMDNKGKLSLDKTKFGEAVDKNLIRVVALFGEEKGWRPP